MQQRTEPVQFEEFLSNAPSIFEKIEEEGKTMLVERGGNIFSIKMNKPKAKSRSRTKSRAITPDDSMLGIIGLGRSGGPGDVSRNKHKYLADAIADLHKE